MAEHDAEFGLGNKASQRLSVLPFLADHRRTYVEAGSLQIDACASAVEFNHFFMMARILLGGGMRTWPEFTDALMEEFDIAVFPRNDDQACQLG